MRTWPVDSKPEVVCLGETMGQLVLAPPKSFHGEVQLLHAGAESNVAIGLARLQHQVAWVSRLGSDAVGERVLSAVGAEGVDCRGVQRVAGGKTGLLVKEVVGDQRTVTYHRSDSAASMMDRSDVTRALSTDAQIIHVSGVTAALSPTCDDAVGSLLSRDIHSLKSFDVNYRASLWRDVATASNRLRQLAELSDILMVGLDEADELWGAQTAHDVRALFPGVPQVLVKDGARAAVLFTNSASCAVPALPAAVIDSVGAGDAFAAGFLSGILRRWTGEHCLRLGHLMARSTVVSVSDQGHPPHDVLKTALDDNLWSK